MYSTIASGVQGLLMPALAANETGETLRGRRLCKQRLGRPDWVGDLRDGNGNIGRDFKRRVSGKDPQRIEVDEVVDLKCSGQNRAKLGADGHEIGVQGVNLSPASFTMQTQRLNIRGLAVSRCGLLGCHPSSFGLSERTLGLRYDACVLALCSDRLLAIAFLGDLGLMLKLSKESAPPCHRRSPPFPLDRGSNESRHTNRNSSHSPTCC